MTTDKTLDAWKNWLAYSISKTIGSPISAFPIQLRDSNEVKTYPGIYLSEARVDRVTPGGVMDGNVWEIDIQTQLVTTPGEDDQLATSKSDHNIFRNALSLMVNGCDAQAYLGSQIGLTCFDVQSSSPVTTDEDGYRVTTWKNQVVVCVA